jgi:ribosome maturation factor RimP
LAQIFEQSKAELRYREVFEPVVKAQGLEIYDLEYIQGQALVRLYIRNPKTKSATIDECASVDRALSPVFESETWMPEKIVLEVSSPGVTRKLKSLEHFQEAKNENILLHLLKKLSSEDFDLPKKIKGQNKFVFTLKDISEEELIGLVEDQGEKKEVRVKFNNIKKATIEPDWEKIMNSENPAESTTV